MPEVETSRDFEGEDSPWQLPGRGGVAELSSAGWLGSGGREGVPVAGSLGRDVEARYWSSPLRSLVPVAKARAAASCLCVCVPHAAPG